ncbi:hypothetical protein GCM10008018_00160 [Paenibacillus marchantiophytorum]|uniref:Spore coat protein U domain-containing protein n=1 Tax=Paenibacillus marchantiophytorum TaxID=1619310 RepID=A0ABQ2BPK0_9BACL|nr:hypothetical protein [Paenibacillus marchantiophytorum]GGI43060.1 hypothetical protein GCM10008018_00160 [Paenibacillus marchantiophytorum]
MKNKILSIAFASVIMASFSVSSASAADLNASKYKNVTYDQSVNMCQNKSNYYLESEPNGNFDYADNVCLYGNNYNYGTIGSSNDVDVYSFKTGPMDAGRTVSVILNNPNVKTASFALNKEYGSSFPKTYFDFSDNRSEGATFTAEANTRYNIYVNPADSSPDPSQRYYVSVSIQ